MKLLFILILLVGFGFSLNQEIQKETALQTQLDETRQQLDDAKKQIQVMQEQQTRTAQQNQQNRGGVGSNAPSMWNDPTNPLNARPSRSGQHQ
jgi:hypothetical protein